jgi:putative transposase
MPTSFAPLLKMKQRNPTWGCPRIAEQINLAFETSTNKDVVRRILALHYRPAPDADGPSWLTFLGHMKDSLWSLDLLRCESVALRTYWVLMVMDQYTRRIIGFGIQAGVVNGDALCHMFKQAIRVAAVPKYLNSDHDPCIGIINGKQTCEFWAARKSKQFLTFRCRIRSSSD